MHLYSWRANLSWMDLNILQEKSMNSIIAKRFASQYYFLVLLWAIPGICPPQGLLLVLGILFSCYLSIRHFCYFLSFQIFYYKIVLLTLRPVVSLSSCILHRLISNYFKLFWNVLFCLYCLIQSRYILRFLSFVDIFWFIASISIVRFVHNIALHLALSYLYFDFDFSSRKFLFGFLRGIPILFQSSLASAWVKSFCSVIFACWDICW